GGAGCGAYLRLPYSGRHRRLEEGKRPASAAIDLLASQFAPIFIDFEPTSPKKPFASVQMVNASFTEIVDCSATHSPIPRLIQHAFRSRQPFALLSAL